MSDQNENPPGSTPADPAPPEASGRDRLRQSFLRPSRGQVIVAGLVCLLAFAAVTQVRISGRGDAYADLRQPELIQALNGLQSATRQAERDIAELEATRDRLRSSTEARGAALEQARSEVQTLGVLAGTVAATGPGIRISVEDPEGELSLTHLLDGIEELRNAGVEAMEINDQVRVVAQTSFEDSPEGIRVDGVELRAPYVIDAIGSPTTLSGALAFDGGFIDDVELDSGKVAVQEADRIEVASTRRHTQPRYAQPDPGQ